MTISRWKVMAGVLGVSLGGLAAIAGQCQKPDVAKTQRAADPLVMADALKVSPGGSGPTPPAAKPTGPAGSPPDLIVPPPDLPSPPASPAAAQAPKLPVVLPPSVPSSQPIKPVDLLPPPAEPKALEVKKPDVTPVGASLLPQIPAGREAPPAPPAAVDSPKPTLVEPPVPATKPAAAPAGSPVGLDPVPSRPTPVEFTKPAGGPPAPTATVAVPPTASVTPSAPPVAEPAVDLTPVKGVAATSTAAPAMTKFRIVLRVGEGEPMFEVRHGDDLVMKVVCEKVDIKSPEKGQGMSAVTATGKVRFVGFGAEGVCDSFSFLAGTGEVSMTGNVKVQVKDKIGRVESELTTEKMQYRLDSNAMPGVLKP